ncbi:uncharacterized protein TNCV_1692421 [Trichonephila clavipes]|nr:uncharacterized protein TNCV_1692421 [Trichonephila clavipes]
MWEALNTIRLNICRTMCESGHLSVHTELAMSSRVANRLPRIGFFNLENEVKVTGLISPLENGYFDVITLFNTGLINLISQDAHQLTNFPAFATLLPVITDPYVVLRRRYACRTSTRHIYVCDPFTYLHEKKYLP